jgi:hypothetical protein
MDEILSIEPERLVKVRTNYADKLIHIQEKLDEEVMVVTLRFDEILLAASKVLAEASKERLHIV